MPETREAVIPSEVERRKQLIRERQTDLLRWQEPESLAEHSAPRDALAAQMIPSGSVVLDLGCGGMGLERYLPFQCQYRPCDVVPRDARTQVCDFNQGQMPELGEANLITLLEVLEYVYDLPQLLSKIHAYQKPVIVSYHPADTDPHRDREALGWVNHLSQAELKEQFETAGFAVQQEIPLDEQQLLFRLLPNAPLRPVRYPRVLVMSYNNFGNFGDRIGYHLMQQVLPPNAIVTEGHFEPWDVAPDFEFDLLVVGIGNSIFHRTLTEEFFQLVERAPKVVGIFGTQYRSMLDVKLLNRLLDKLTVWFARTEEDILLYGKGRDNIVHLGDWIVQAFPFTQWSETDILNISYEAFHDTPLDQTIQKIQRFQHVISYRIHPLLCALTSADRVAYSEQCLFGEEHPSGKFRSLLMDIFGREYPEKSFFKVDRDAVAAYKTFVTGQVQVLKQTLHDLLSE